MPNFIHADNANEAWSQAVDLLLTSPEATVIEGRGGITTELLHVTITIKNPRQRWIFARQPAINPAFALAEAIWIISGRNDSRVLNFFNRDLSKYAGAGPTFYGAYGHRLRHQLGIDQLEAAYLSFSSNPNTRQIVLQIWDAHADLPDQEGRPRSPDIPCNTQALLRIQNGKLHWLQTMRSNDVFRGLPYNIVQFTMLHEVIAGWLGVELGDYSHVINCLHFYHTDLSDLKKSHPVPAILNTDSVMCKKSESDEKLALLSKLISEAGTNIGQVKSLAQSLDVSDQTTAFKNIGNVILAEAARRHNHLDLALDLLSQVTNTCLRELTKASFSRFAKVVF